jgi:hypothetical protein
MDILLCGLLVQMQGNYFISRNLFNSKRCRFLFSDFVSTRVLHNLYKLCCKKRFRADDVQIIEPVPRVTLYKYLVIPKDNPPASSEQATTDSRGPYLLPRSSSNDDQSSEAKRRPSRIDQKTRSRSDSLPSIQESALQQKQPQAAKRSKSRPKHDEQE